MPIKKLSALWAKLESLYMAGTTSCHYVLYVELIVGAIGESKQEQTICTIMSPNSMSIVHFPTSDQAMIVHIAQ
ncbi:MAG: hypothetical protein IT328_21725 [Caldilineaceae bacterium]|nr:hypothetical protein [Caldilineaceae bacterium]